MNYLSSGLSGPCVCAPVCACACPSCCFCGCKVLANLLLLRISVLYYSLIGFAVCRMAFPLLVGRLIRINCTMTIMHIFFSPSPPLVLKLRVHSNPPIISRDESYMNTAVNRDFSLFFRGGGTNYLDTLLLFLWTNNIHFLLALWNPRSTLLNFVDF